MPSASRRPPLPRSRQVRPSLVLGVAGLVLFTALGMVAGGPIRAVLMAAVFMLGTGAWATALGRSWLGKWGRARGSAVLATSFAVVLVFTALLPSPPASTAVGAETDEPSVATAPSSPSPTVPPSPSPRATTTPPPTPQTRPTESVPPPPPPSPRVAGDYTGVLTVIVYDGWYDEPEMGDPVVGDQLHSSLTMNADCDTTDSCSFEHTSFDPASPDSGGVFSAATERTRDSSRVTYSDHTTYDCVDEAGSAVGDVAIGIEYEFTFGGAVGGAWSTVAVRYEINTSSDTELCEPANTVVIGTLTR